MGVIGRIRARWPAVEIVVRGDSHYGRPEAMAWCERQQVGYILATRCCCGRSARSPEDAALGRLADEGEKVCRHGDFRHAAKSWNVERRVIARVEAGPQGADSRFIVTNLRGLPKTLYEKVYCARGQAGNLIKAQQAAPRLRPHFLPQGDRQPVPPVDPHRRLLADAEPARSGSKDLLLARDAQFDTIRLCLIKVAGRVTEMVTRIKIALPSAPSLSGRLYRLRRPHRQAAAVSDGAVAPVQTLWPNRKPRPARHRRHEKPRPISAITGQPPAPHE